jgi:hypothetical protein
MFRKYYYYYLRDPGTEEIRYIGITLRPKDRYYDHIHDAKTGKEKNTWKANWIKSLLAQNKKPRMDIFRVFITNTADEAYNLEQDLLEEHFKNGHNLVNVLKVPYSGSNPGSVRKKVYQYDGVTGEFIQEFPSVSDASRAVNAKIDGSVRRPGKSIAGGYCWSFDKKERIVISIIPRGRPSMPDIVRNSIQDLYRENPSLSVRQLWRLCKSKGFNVSRETVRSLMNAVKLT